MIKRILVFFISVVIIFSVTFNTNNFLVEDCRFSILNMYLFHALFSFLIYLIIEITTIKLSNQSGFVYLTTIFIKIGVFLLIFQGDVFGEFDLSKSERISIVAPMLIFLMLEALFISKLLNSK